MKKNNYASIPIPIPILILGLLISLMVCTNIFAQDNISSEYDSKLPKPHIPKQFEEFINSSSFNLNRLIPNDMKRLYEQGYASPTPIITPLYAIEIPTTADVFERHYYLKQIDLPLFNLAFDDKKQIARVFSNDFAQTSKARGDTIETNRFFGIKLMSKTTYLVFDSKSWNGKEYTNFAFVKIRYSKNHMLVRSNMLNQLLSEYDNSNDAANIYIKEPIQNVFGNISNVFRSTNALLVNLTVQSFQA